MLRRQVLARATRGDGSIYVRESSDHSQVLHGELQVREGLSAAGGRGEEPSAEVQHWKKQMLKFEQLYFTVLHTNLETCRRIHGPALLDTNLPWHYNY